MNKQLGQAYIEARGRDYARHCEPEPALPPTALVRFMRSDVPLVALALGWTAVVALVAQALANA